MIDDSQPGFLLELDANPDWAFEGFYKYAVAQLSDVPPRPMRGLSRDDFWDRLHDIIYHCTKNDFKVLRSYVPRGKPFGGFLYIVAHRCALDWIEAKRRKMEVIPVSSRRERGNNDEITRDSGVDGWEQSKWSELIHLVPQALNRLDSFCRLLVQLAADEYTPKEIAGELVKIRVGNFTNKEISDRIRYCRKILVKDLGCMGIDIISLLALKKKKKTKASSEKS